MRERNRLDAAVSGYLKLEQDFNDSLELLEMAEAENDAAMVADAEKTLLLVLFGVARTQKYITEKKVHELQTKLNELGRIIGGLQKHFINNR